jgi:hypothetical protein
VHIVSSTGRSNNIIIERTMKTAARRSLLNGLMLVLVMMAGLAGCGNNETGKTAAESPPSLPRLPSVQPTVQSATLPAVQPTLTPAVLPTVQQTVQPSIQPTPTLFIPGPLFDARVDLRALPVEVPLELQIPALKVDAPMLGVGLTPGNEMDAPKGPIGDPVWHTAFWYRGSGIPGAPGTATIAGHVDDQLGRPEIFAHLNRLRPGDQIIIHVKNSSNDIHFEVTEVRIYSLQESSDPAVMAQIFGSGPVAGLGPQPSPDGLSHLTLITCAGNYVDGLFDHHTVVYATRIKG